MSPPGTPRNRGRWLAAGAGLLVVMVVVGLRTREGPSPPADQIEARIDFYRARIGGPGTYPAYARLGLAYLDRARATGNAADREEAARHLFESNRLQPNYEALRGLTEIELARHRFPEALRYAEEAAKSQPGSIEAQAALFDALLATGETAQAQTLLETMLAGQPGFAAFTRQANLFELRGNHRDALDAMRRACTEAEKQNAPVVTQAWCQVRLGSVFVALCDEAQAERAYQRALTLLPGYFLAREHLAEMRAAQARQAEAVALYEELLQTHPGPHYRLALAGLLGSPAEQNRAQELRGRALEELRRSARSASREEWRPLALLLLEDNATVPEGVQWAERDWVNRRDAFAADTLAWARFRSGQVSEAAQLSEQALGPGAGSRNPAFLLHAAEIQRALKRPAQARALLGQATACPLRLQPGERATASRLVDLFGYSPKRQDLGRD